MVVRLTKTAFQRLAAWVDWFFAKREPPHEFTGTEIEEER